MPVPPEVESWPADFEDNSIVLGTVQRACKLIQIALSVEERDSQHFLHFDLSLLTQGSDPIELGTLTALDGAAPIGDWHETAEPIGLRPDSAFEHGLIRLVEALAAAYCQRRPLEPYFGFRPDPASPIPVVTHTRASV